MRKNKKRFVPWKMQAITTAHSVGAQLCESLTNCSSPAGRWWGWPNGPSQGFSRRTEKNASFLWNLRALKWWLMLNCFMVRAWAKFIVLTFCLKVHAARPMGLISWGTGGRGIWSWRTRTAHERKIWPGWYFGQGERPAHRVHRGKRLRTPAL